MKNKIEISSENKLNQYDLACGYVQLTIYESNKKRVYLKLYQDGCYHVEVFVYDIVEPHKGCLGIETVEELVICHNYFSGKDWRSVSCRKRYARLKRVIKRYLESSVFNKA